MSYDIEHEHKFFIFQVKADFEPVNAIEIDAKSIYKQDATKQYYIRTEYAILGCNCGAAIRTKVKRSDA